MSLREVAVGLAGGLRIPRRPRAVDTDALVDRFTALRAFLNAAAPAVPDTRLAAARELDAIAGERLALSRDHTLVALVGATGSGKSSLFNALTGRDWSPVGVRRPTTGFTHAGVWGPGGDELLDWLGVPPARRMWRDDQAPATDPSGGAAAAPPPDDPLDGLVLLDLPDFDSVVPEHRAEVDRLLPLVDLVVWVLDPQKYADALVHDRYLRTYSHLEPVTVVVLNQADRLHPADVRRCLDDLTRLLAADGLAGVPVMAASSVAEPGTAGLRAALGAAVEARQSLLRRLGRDLDMVVADLSPLVDSRAGSRHDAADTELTQALASMAGVPAVAVATGRAYRHRAIAAMGWPVTRWLGRLRPDPLRRLHLAGISRRDADPALTARPAAAGADGDSDTDRIAGLPAGPIEATSIPAASAAQRAAAMLAIRAMAERAGADLPEPWPAAVAAAARSRLDRLPDALDTAIAGTPLGLERRPIWWRVVGALQWLVTVIALAGLAWLAARLALLALGLPDISVTTVGILPLPTLLLLAGASSGLLIGLLVRPAIGLGARRAAARARRRLNSAVADVAAEYVTAPVAGMRQRYRAARDALATAGTAGR